MSYIDSMCILCIIQMTLRKTTLNVTLYCILTHRIFRLGTSIQTVLCQYLAKRFTRYLLSSRTDTY